MPKVHALTDQEKAALKGFQEEQAKLNMAQQDLNGRINTALQGFSATSGLKLPVVISDDGNYAIEAQRHTPDNLGSQVQPTRPGPQRPTTPMRKAN